MNAKDPFVATPNAAKDDTVSVGIGRWAVAAAPVRLHALLGSCVGVLLYDGIARAGGMAHILLPDSQGADVSDHPGKYANTAIPAMLADLERLIGSRSRLRMVAKLVGGAMMFQTTQLDAIGERNQRAVERTLEGLGIRVAARDLGGQSGRRVTLDTATGRVTVRILGQGEYEL
jgi:chemotaxis protein CheD